jgi:hypothetical protein
MFPLGKNRNISRRIRRIADTFMPIFVIAYFKSAEQQLAVASADLKS